MRRLTLYLVQQTALAIVIALASLALLFSFFELMSELGAVSAGKYSLSQMAMLILLGLPARIHEVMPIAVLLGGLYTFARLAQTSEYTVMRASAWSTRDSLKALLIVGGIFGLATLLVGEAVLPYSEHFAERIKTQSTQRVQAQQFRSGLWARDGQDFLNIRQVLPDTTLQEIRIYTVESGKSLQRVVEAAHGHWNDNGFWQLQDGRLTLFTPQGARTESFKTWDWRSNVGPDLLEMLMVKPQHMSIRALYEYIQHLRANRQKATRYEVALWKKLVYPLSPIVMLMLSLPFAYYHARGSKLGGKLMAGLGVGLVFHLTSKALGDLSLLRDGSPFWGATLPLLAFALIAWLILLRIERV